jgi:hypothetical protein
MTTHNCWYREAWEQLWNGANDDESGMLTQLALRCEVFWVCLDCTDSQVIPNDEKCEGCGRSVK